MENTRLEVIDILDKMQFFQGQRAGRELWNEKPFNIQEQDIDNFNRHIRVVRDYIWDLEHELKAYRDAEEQGLLLRLPCKVGDTVYSIEVFEIKEFVVTEFEITKSRIVAWQGHTYVGDMGISVFATKEEAEQKLASMQKGE